MRIAAALLSFGLVAGLAACAGQQTEEKSGPKKGDLVYKSNFSDPAERAKWSTAPFAAWVPEGKDGKTVLKVTVPSTEKPGHHKISMPIDLKPYQGMQLYLTCKAKAKNVTKAPQSYNGVKWMLHYKSPAREFWGNQNDVHGTFDWKELGFTANVEEGVESSELYLGLEMCTGEVSFDELEIVVSKGKSQIVRPAPMANPPPPYTGHDGIPRLRGAMSPNQFKDEDFQVFANEWNANLVRWQITRFWGKANTDTDLVEYDKWIDEEMADLDKLLEAALKYRFKVVIDLHSPPGGRYEDRSMRMFYEQKYNDHFVEIWEKLASRYKGHPAVWGYDLVNEPVEGKPAPEGMDSHATQTRAAKAIRKIDPKTAIIVESLEWDAPRAYAEMTPFDVPNVVYQVHMYEPGQFTHQGVHNNPTGVVYPGKIGSVEYDKEALRKVLKPVRDFQLAYNVQIYVGEFSAARWAPGSAKYLSDCIDIFEDYGWDWSYHAFREWDGWSVEHGSDPQDHKPTVEPTDRKQLLLSWFKKNQKPVFKKD